MASRRTRKYKSLSNYLESLSVDAKELRIRNDYSGVGSTAINSEQFADDVQLIDKTLQSNNYISGSTGWAISGTGNVEFGNAYVRGDINATSGTIGYWHISQPTVQRTFGDTTLFGTFLESTDHGYDDLSATTGSYVSLFKSYDDDAMAFSAVSIDSNFVTLTIYDHRYGVDDSIIVTFTDAAYAAYETTETSLGTIVSTTPTTITYDVGTVNENGAGDIGTTAASGDVLLYIEDVAGLYLRDYKKREFDYGFFSNKGVKYLSASDLNFVKNSTAANSTIGTSTIQYWSATTNATAGVVTQALNIDELSIFPSLYNHSPEGVNVKWASTAPADTENIYVSVDAAAMKDYKVAQSSRTLYFNFDVFYHASRLPSVEVNSFTANTTHVTLVCNVAHGLSVGNIFYADFAAYGYDTDLVRNDYAEKKAYTVATVVNTTALTYTHAFGTALNADTVTYPPVVDNYSNYRYFSAWKTDSASLTRNITLQFPPLANRHQYVVGDIIDVVYSADPEIASDSVTVTATTLDSLTYATEDICYIASAWSNAAAATSYTVPISDNANYGDLVIVEIGSDGGVINTPAGWTALDSTTVGSEQHKVIYKVMGTTPDTSVTITGLATASTMVLMVFRGVDMDTPINVSSTTAGSTGVPAPPAVTTSVAGCMIVVTGSLDDDTVTAVTAPTGYEGLQWETSSTAGQTSMMAYKIKTTAGVETPGAFTATGGNDEWVSSTIALNPARKSGTSYTNVTVGATATVYHDGLGQIYRAYTPEYDLTKIRLKFGSDTSTTLYSVLTTAEQAMWDDKKTRFSIPTDYMGIMSGDTVNDEYVDQMKSKKMSVFEIDASKVLAAYEALDPVGYEAGTDFSIVFPAYLYSGANPLDVSYSTTKLSAAHEVGIILDNVQLSTSSSYFDTGLLGGTSTWYGNVPYEASIREPVSWIDIDLDTQKATLSVDAIYIQNTHFSQVLFNDPQLSEADLGNRLRYPLGTLDRSDKNAIAAGATIEGWEGSIWRGSYVGDVALNDDISSIGIFGGEFSDSDTALGIESTHSSHVVAYTSGYLTGVELFTGGYSDVAGTATYTDEYGPTLRMWHNRNNDRGYMDLFANTRLTIMSPNTFIPNIQTNYQKDLTNTSSASSMPQILSMIDADTVTTTSTSWTSTVSGGSALVGYFTAPASGNVLITVEMSGQNSNTSRSISMSFQIDTVDSSGNVLDTIRTPNTLHGTYGNTNNYLPAATIQGTNLVKSTSTYIFDGAENQRYKITGMYLAGTSSTGSMYTRKIVVLPIF